MPTLLKTVLVAVAFMSTSTWTLAGVLSGTIKNSKGAALEGVLIRITDDVSGISESVYSNADGEFVLSTGLEGDLALRLRTPYYRDLRADISLGVSESLNQNYAMVAMSDEQEISDSLPAAYHFGSLDFETGDDAVFNRFQFQRDCLSCHQLGNEMTRQPRSAESWEMSILRMHQYVGSNFDAELRKRRSLIFTEGFDGKPLSVRPEFPLDPSLSQAKLYEYRMEKGIVPHDAIVNQNDGLIYTVDQSANHMAITNPGTGKTEYISQSGKGQQHWVPDTELKKVESFKPSTRNGPHSLAMGHDGKYYVTNAGSATIGVFNPETKQWEPSFLVGSGARYPHTIRVGLDGMVWFTLAGSEQVGRLDPTTGETHVIRLPDVKSSGVSGGTQPYGIDVNPKDGSIWYTRLFGDKVGRVDAETLALQEFDSPVRGPRRIRFDEQGILWLTGYSEGFLARLQVTATGFTSTEYEMPEFADGFRPAPYALGVHPQTNDVWINENMTDRLFRFIPSEERFVVYPVPLVGTYTRDFSFTKDGKACTSNNPLPITSLEEGVAEILCIELHDSNGSKVSAAEQ